MTRRLVGAGLAVAQVLAVALTLFVGALDH